MEFITEESNVLVIITIKNGLIKCKLKFESYIQQIEGTSLIKRSSINWFGVFH
jgi:hypothetical protein